MMDIEAYIRRGVCWRRVELSPRKSDVSNGEI